MEAHDNNAEVCDQLLVSIAVQVDLLDSLLPEEYAQDIEHLRLAIEDIAYSLNEGGEGEPNWNIDYLFEGEEDEEGL